MGDLEHLNADTEAWLAEAVEGPGLPQGYTNATVLATDATFMACTTNAQRAAFLATYAPFAALWARVVGLTSDPVFWVGIDMIMNAVLREAQRLREEEG
jgi:hypothetical protein